MIEQQDENQIDMEMEMVMVMEMVMMVWMSGVVGGVAERRWRSLSTQVWHHDRDLFLGA